VPDAHFHACRFKSIDYLEETFCYEEQDGKFVAWKALDSWVVLWVSYCPMCGAKAPTSRLDFNKDIEARAIPLPELDMRAARRRMRLRLREKKKIPRRLLATAAQGLKENQVGELYWRVANVLFFPEDSENKERINKLFDGL